MDELAKIRRVLGRLNPEAPHDVVLVLDATTGQNALSQIEMFREVAGVTGLVMTKLDGTARGGVLVAAAERFGLPIHAIGDRRGRSTICGRSTRARAARAIAGLGGVSVTGSNRKPGARPSVAPAADRSRAAARLLPGQLPRAVADSRDLHRDRRLHGRRSIVAMMISLAHAIGHVSPMLWFSAIMVVGCSAAITIWLHDETLHQDEADHLLCAGREPARSSAWSTGRNLLKMVLGTAYPGPVRQGLEDADPQLGDLLRWRWRVVNEVVWRNCSTSFWHRLRQIVGHYLPVTFLFAFANMPMLMRHGLTVLEKAKEEPPVPPIQ